MPTFRSIPIHPSVRSRLLHPQQQDANDDTSDVRNANKPIKSGVRIPRSLLTRDPNDLVEMFSGGPSGGNAQQMAGVLTLRSQVAHAMIAKTRNGKRILSHQREDVINASKRRLGEGSLIPGGSTSLLDAWNSQRQETLSTNRVEVVSTGCRELDDLVAFPAEYFVSFENRSNSYSVDIQSGEAKGLPRGYVLQLSGTLGKTQLALQFAAQAMRQLCERSTRTHERIRYCYSSAGHAGNSLAQRLFELIEHNHNGDDNNSGSGSDHRLRKEVAKRIEFQPISTISQLVSTIAKLEQEWLQRTRPSEQEQSEEQRKEISRGKGPAMLVLDALPSMLVEREDADRIQSLDRWLRRLARHYHVWIVIITPSGGGGSTTSLYNNTMSPDIHLNLEKQTSTRSNLKLMRHPAKVVTEKDSIPLLHSSKLGMTTPE